jgi:hypothetical protein
MGSDGMWQIWMYEEATNYFTDLDSGGSNYINMKKATNLIGASCIGDELTFYINGYEITSIRNNKFRQGNVGVSIYAFDIPGSGVEFDWFFVEMP